MKKIKYFIAFLTITNVSLSNDYSNNYKNSSNQKNRSLKIKEKIQDEQNKMKMNTVITLAGLGLFFLGTRNQTEKASNTQLFTHLTGVVLTGVGSLLGLKSLQDYFILKHKSNTPERQTVESAKTTLVTATK